MCETFAFGEWPGGGVYAVQRWIDGEDAEAVLPRLTPDAQYEEGLEAGRVLRLIHSLPIPEDTRRTLPDWEVRFSAKIDRKIRGYLDCPLRIEGDAHLFRYIEETRPLLRGRPNACQHGDYHVGNMMIESGRLIIIDFDRFDFGDPWEEFNRIVGCAQKSPLFARGMVNGYFEDSVPPDFWRLLALYISSNTLSSVPWAIPFGEGQIEVFIAQAKEILDWYDGMKRTVPRWYTEP
jgi:aminoglycoside phosphotransferase (APT) family kinase protein